MKKYITVYALKDEAKWEFVPTGYPAYMKSWWQGYLHGFKLVLQGHTIHVEGYK